MKTFAKKLLACRIARWSLPIAVLAVVAASLAWTGEGQKPYRLGGVWVGQLSGIQWTSTHAPLDPEARTAISTLQWITSNEQFEYLTGALGANLSSQGSGMFKMINNDTAKYRIVFYAYAEGVASTTTPKAGEIKAIYIMDGTWHYTGPDSAESQETLALYLPTETRSTTCSRRRMLSHIWSLLLGRTRR